MLKKVRVAKDGGLELIKNFNFSHSEGIMSKKRAISEVKKTVDLDIRLDHKSLHKHKCTCEIKKR